MALAPSSKLLGKPGSLPNPSRSAEPPTYTIVVGTASLQATPCQPALSLAFHQSQDLCGRTVHVQDNYRSGRLTHQIAHIWGHIQLG